MPESSSSSESWSNATVGSGAVLAVGEDGGLNAHVRQRLGIATLMFRFVNFNMLLQRVDQVFLEIFRRQCLVGDFAQRDDRVLVVVARDGNLPAGRDLPCAMAGQKHQFKTVFHLVDAVLDSDACHVRLP